jgi:hypothetical protein
MHILYFCVIDTKYCLYSEDQYKNYIEALQRLFSKIHVLGMHMLLIYAYYIYKLTAFFYNRKLVTSLYYGKEKVKTAST